MTTRRSTTLPRAIAMAAAALTLAATVSTTHQAQAASITTWDKVAQCESGGDWSINTGTTYLGGLQISLHNWQYYGGTEYAARPDLATKKQQILIAERILADQGYRAWDCWPGTGLDTDRSNPYPDPDPSQPSATAQQFFHTVRQSDGSWTGFGSLAGANGATEFKGAEAAIAGMPDGSSQVLGIGLDGNVYHEVRYANGYWSGFQALPGVSAPTMQAHKVAITAMPDGSAQILAIASNGLVYHQTRYADGNWSGFQLIRGVDSDTMQAKEIAIAGTPDGATQVLAIGSNDLVYHKARYANGTWSEFQLLAGVGWPTMKAQKVVVSGAADGTAQVLAIGADGNVYHEARYASGEWSGFQPITGVNAPTMKATQIAIAATPDGAAQILAIAPDNNLIYHKARYANGTWSNFQLVPGAAGANTFAANTIAITGLPNNSTQILATGH